jgi:hypothetical protein
VRSDEFKWVSSSKPVADANKPKPEKHLGKGFPNTKFTEEKSNFEKRHMLDRVAETT